MLEYDGVPKHRRAGYLAKVGEMARSTAYRLLNEAHAVVIPRRLYDLSDGLDVDWEWLWRGKFGRFDVRTMRIHIQAFNDYPKEDTDRMMRMLVGKIAGHRKAENLFNLAADRKLSFLGAARLL